MLLDFEGLQMHMHHKILPRIVTAHDLAAHVFQKKNMIVHIRMYTLSLALFHAAGLIQ